MENSTRNWTYVVSGYNLLFLGFLLYQNLTQNVPYADTIRLFLITLAFSIYSIIFCALSVSDRTKLTIRKLYFTVPFFAAISAAWLAYGLLDDFQLKELWAANALPTILLVVTFQGYLLTLWWCYALLNTLMVVLSHFQASFLRAAVLVLYFGGTGYAAYELYMHFTNMSNYSLYYNIWYFATEILQVLVKGTIAFYITEQRLSGHFALRKNEFWYFTAFVGFTTLLLLGSVVASKIVNQKVPGFVDPFTVLNFRQAWFEAAIHLGLETIIFFALTVEGCCYYRSHNYYYPSAYSSSNISLIDNEPRSDSNNSQLVMPLIQPVNPVAIHIDNPVSAEHYRAIQEQQDQGRGDRSRSIYFAKECCICGEEYENKATALNCGHIVHKKCLEEWIQRKKECPICRKPVT